MRAAELAERLSLNYEVETRGMSHDLGIELTSVENDSRRIDGRSGVIYACVPGVHYDGHDFAEEAFRKGAALILCERPLELPIPQIIVPKVRGAMGSAASILLDEPSAKLMMIGLTGTNGKTTTAYLARSAMRACGIKTGMIGTVIYDDGEDIIEAGRTTPEGPTIQRLLARMLDNGVKCCVAEASSHGLHQGRLDGCLFDSAGFSNLTHEHLEYHNDMDSYFEAKKLLFSKYMKDRGQGRSNLDDPKGAELVRDFAPRVVGFAVDHADISGTYRGTVVSTDIRGSSVDVRYPDGETVRARVPLLGTHNVYNALEALACVDVLGADRHDAAAGIERCEQVPGRLERYVLSNGVTVFVDFAHSPDGIAHILEALRPYASGDLAVVWGAGGDRSKTKRPEAGEIMAKLADISYITSDNPRSEDPRDIAKDVEMGFASYPAARRSVILDRKEAIDTALASAGAGDIVVVAGKGPEREIVYADRIVPFSDNEAVMDWARRSGVEVLTS